MFIWTIEDVLGLGFIALLALGALLLALCALGYLAYNWIKSKF